MAKVKEEEYIRLIEYQIIMETERANRNFAEGRGKHYDDQRKDAILILDLIRDYREKSFKLKEELIELRN